MLTVNEIATITKELLLHQAPTLTTPEANALREEIKADLADMEKRGVIADIPYDFE